MYIILNTIINVIIIMVFRYGGIMLSVINTQLNVLLMLKSVLKFVKSLFVYL